MLEELYIGILVSSLVNRGIKKGKTYYENLAFYEEAGKKYNLTPCFFSLKELTPDEDHIKAFVMGKSGEYEEKLIPKPLIIHNRGYSTSMAAKKQFKKLQKEGIIFFNEKTRYSKLKIYKILMKNKELIKHIPETMIANKENVKNMMNKYNELIIKPKNGSLGSHIVKLALNEDQWQMEYPYKKSWIKESFINKCPPKLQKIISNSRYLIQQRISLATYNGNPFDLRVSVQKNEYGKWQVSGIVGKVAKKGRFLTNVAKGGTCFPLDVVMKDLPHLDFKKVTKEIEQFSIKVAKQLEKELTGVADIGIDIGITNEGYPMFIECNGRDLRITFRNANLLEEWKATHMTPLGYGKYLSQIM